MGKTYINQFRNNDYQIEFFQASNGSIIGRYNLSGCSLIEKYVVEGISKDILNQYLQRGDQPRVEGGKITWIRGEALSKELSDDEIGNRKRNCHPSQLKQSGVLKIQRLAASTSVATTRVISQTLAEEDEERFEGLALQKYIEAELMRGVGEGETCEQRFNYVLKNLSDTDVVEQLVPQLQNAESPFSLDLSGNNITAKGLESLCKISHLRCLDISNNPIGNEGARCLAECPSIKKLTAHHCRIGSEGAQAFLQSTTLEEIWLHVGNELGDNGDELIELIDNHLRDNKAQNDPSYQATLESERKRRELEILVMRAIEKDNVKDLFALVGHLEDGVDTKLEYGCNLLFYALRKQSNSCFEALIRMGARIEGVDEGDKTLLFTAAENGNSTLVELLLKRGANITGEFYFNDETALSIAAFKFSELFVDLLNQDFSQYLDNYHQISSKIINFWSRLKADNTIMLPLWQLFSLPETSLFDSGEAFLALYKRIRENVPSLTSSEIDNRANIFDLIREKFQILRENAPSRNEDEYQTDEDESLELVHKIEPIVRTCEKLGNLTLDQLQKQIDRLNQELKQGKTEADIDWSKFPKFFIVQYRGVHYYRCHFSKKQRANHRATSHLNRVAPAGAAYKISGLNPTQHQLARESTIKKNVQIIRDTFRELKSTPPVKLYWRGDNKRTFKNSSDMMQQRMSNSYEGYRKDLVNSTHPAPKLLAERNVTGYPHYATSDLPMHALRYVYGQKPIDGLKEERLRPQFQKEGKAFHPYPGKAYLTMFTPLQLYYHDARQVAGMHNRKEMDLTGTIAPERETSLPGGVDEDVSFYEELMQIPSFEQYQSDYEEKYGITENDFRKFKRNIALSWTDPDQNKRDRLRKAVKKKMINKIIEHKENGLLRLAREEAQRRGGYLIFRHYDGEYGITFEKMRIPSRGAPSYTKKEKAIIEQLLSNHNPCAPLESPSSVSTLPTFVHEGLSYAAQPTLGDGACAIHALLGKEDTSGTYRINDSRDVFTKKLEEMLNSTLLSHSSSSSSSESGSINHVTQIQDAFYEVMTNYLKATDRSAQMLFGEENKKGCKMRLLWEYTEGSFNEDKQSLISQEAELWKFHLEQNDSILQQMLDEIKKITDPNSLYYGKNEEDVLTLLKTDPNRFMSRIEEQPEQFLGMISGRTNEDQIQEIREARRRLNAELEEKTRHFILSKRVIDHYIEVVSQSDFFLNTNEIKLLALLFKKNVLIFSLGPEGIHLSERILGRPESEEWVVVYHEGAHFSRCIQL